MSPSLFGGFCAGVCMAVALLYLWSGRTGMSPRLGDLDSWTGKRVDVEPTTDDPFRDNFRGVVVGNRHGNLLVRDQDSDVFEVGVSQVRLCENS